jgi:hypothetical protein
MSEPLTAYGNESFCANLLPTVDLWGSCSHALLNAVFIDADAVNRAPFRAHISSFSGSGLFGALAIFPAHGYFYGRGIRRCMACHVHP